MLDLSSKAIAALVSEAESLLSEFQSLLELVKERVSICQVQVGFSKRQELLLSVWVLSSLQGFLQVVDTEVHIGDHVRMLGQIVEHSVLNALFAYNRGNFDVHFV